MTHTFPPRGSSDLEVGVCVVRLRAVQPQEKRPHAATGADAALSPAVASDELAVSGQWPGFSAELSAHELDRLALLGCRAGGVGRTGIGPRDRKSTSLNSST